VGTFPVLKVPHRIVPTLPNADKSKTKILTNHITVFVAQYGKSIFLFIGYSKTWANFIEQCNGSGAIISIRCASACMLAPD